MSTTTSTSRRRRFRRRDGARRGSRGAALVEFALVSIPLFTILFGTIEFGWAFFQLNDIRHGAREGIRLVAVDSDIVPAYTPGGGWASQSAGARIAQATCERMDQSDGVTISIELTDEDGNGTVDKPYDVGDDATLTASKNIDQITKVFDTILKDVVLEETVTTRLEQDPSAGIDGTKWPCQ